MTRISFQGNPRKVARQLLRAEVPRLGRKKGLSPDTLEGIDLVVEYLKNNDCSVTRASHMILGYSSANTDAVIRDRLRKDGIILGSYQRRAIYL